MTTEDNKKVIFVSQQTKVLKRPNKKKITNIREIKKKNYYPLIERAMYPLNNISKRSETLAQTNILTEEKKFKKLYSFIHNKYILTQALGNIYNNKGSLTPGTNNLTFDGMNLRRIENLSNSLKNGTFKFSPYRRKLIEKPKKKGQPVKYKPLGIPNFEDRIVQEAIRIVLNAIYEPIFNEFNLNYGFRPGKSCQDAILKIKISGTACNFAIEGDIKGAYDNVDQDILMTILGKKIEDKKFLKLIYQGCKCGLINQGRYEDTLLGVPQGGIASPILFNIYTLA